MKVFRFDHEEVKGLRIRRYNDGYCRLVGHYIDKNGKKREYSREFDHMDGVQDALGDLGQEQGWCNDDTQPDWLGNIMPVGCYDDVYYRES